MGDQEIDAKLTIEEATFLATHRAAQLRGVLVFVFVVLPLVALAVVLVFGN